MVKFKSLDYMAASKPELEVRPFTSLRNDPIMVSVVTHLL